MGKMPGKVKLLEKPWFYGAWSVLSVLGKRDGKCNASCSERGKARKSAWILHNMGIKRTGKEQFRSSNRPIFSRYFFQTGIFPNSKIPHFWQMYNLVLSFRSFINYA